MSDDEQTDALGGAVGGVPPSELPQTVANLLTDRTHELEIWIRPERVGTRYTVEWTALEYDRTDMDWKPWKQSSTSAHGFSRRLKTRTRQLLRRLISIFTEGMPTFDVDHEQINVFHIDDHYLFKHYFEQDDLFSQLRRYYNESDHRFEVPADELQKVQELLEEHFFECTVVDDLDRFCVVKQKYTNHPDVLFKASVLRREQSDYNLFLMKDQLSVEQAVNNGATRLAESDATAGF